MQLAHYLNGFIERIVELPNEASRHKMEAEMLKIAKDKMSKAIGKASIRADAIERKAQDVEAALKKSGEENS
ncbi:putative paramyosin-like [Cocos nucifera]|nr:putative paramyosin-like [Cocos nucifera]